MKLLLTMLLSACMQPADSLFYSKLVNDFDRNSLFISINMEFLDYKGRVIVENDDLFNYLSKTRKIDKEQYKKLITQKLKKNEAIVFLNSKVSSEFSKVVSLPIVNKNDQMNPEEFIKQYFNGRVLKDGISDEERTAIVQKLFDWKIAVKIDDETGYLIIVK